MELQTGIFSELIAEENARLAVERRSSLENPQTPLSYPAEWLLDIFNGGRTDSGIRVSELTAFQVTTFLACVDLIAGTIAGLPMHVYERIDIGDGKEKHRVASEHDLYSLIHLEPNHEMSSFVFMYALLAQLLAWNGAYAEIQRDAAARAIGLWPRNPMKTRPHRVAKAVVLPPQPWRPFQAVIPAGGLCYRTTDGLDNYDESNNDADRASAGRLIPKEDMIHIPGISFDGRIGQGVVWLARQTIGLALATEKFGAKYFANYAKPGGILTAPLNITQEQRNQARQSWLEAQGGENAHRTAVLPPGWTWQQQSNNPQEAQSVETLQFIRNQICSVFHVPPHMVGDVDKGRANTEQLAQEFVNYTLAPRLAALRKELKRKLFPDSGIGRTPKNRFYVDFDLWDMLRPDAASREAFYRSGKQWGYLSSNDIRARERLNPIEDSTGDEYWMPVNMIPADKSASLVPQSGGAPAVGDEGDGGDGPAVTADDSSAEDRSAARAYEPYYRIFRDACGRLLKRSKRDSRALMTTLGPVLWSLRDALQLEAQQALDVDQARDSSESDGFLAEFVRGEVRRAPEWKQEQIDAVSRAEFDRALRGLRVVVFRELAAARAKVQEAS